MSASSAENTRSQPRLSERLWGCGWHLFWIVAGLLASAAGCACPISLPLILGVVIWGWYSVRSEKKQAINIAQQIRCTSCQQIMGRQAATEGWQERLSASESLIEALDADHEAFARFQGPWAITCPVCEARYSLDKDGYPRPHFAIWQVWRNQNEATCAPIDNIARLLQSGQLPADAELLYEFVARTGEEAMTRYHLLLGWDAYQPIGEPCDCPNECGGSYYPLGYGECPNCGPVG